LTTKHAQAERVRITVLAGTAMNVDGVKFAVRSALDRFAGQLSVTVKPG